MYLLVLLFCSYLTGHVSTAVYERLLRTSEDFVWVTDFNSPGRFIVDVEFLDLKIAPLHVRA